MSFDESGHRPIDIDGVVSGAMNVEIRILEQAFREGVDLVFDYRGRLFHFDRSRFGRDGGHFGHGLVEDFGGRAVWGGDHVRRRQLHHRKLALHDGLLGADERFVNDFAIGVTYMVEDSRVDYR